MMRSHSLQTLSTCLLGSLLALGLAACGSSSEPLGAREQPFSADDTGDTRDEADDSSEGTAAACGAGVAPSEAADGFCQVTAKGLCFDDAADACACAGCGRDTCLLAESFPAQAFCANGDGSDPNAPVGSDPDAPVSNTNPDTPVSDEPSAGGGSDGNSGSGDGSPGSPGSGDGCGSPGQTEPANPTEPACADGSTPEAGASPSCDFIANGACFADVDAACACAGCGSEGCVVLESYPAIVRCE